MTNKPKCPFCGHILSDNEMNAEEKDLWAIAPNEEDADIFCPKCDKQYLCRGGYLSTYISTGDPEGFET